MEAIKCPNCGSEKVQELTEEKYVCLACDNIFLVHNLSKEFRQTEAHIENVHEDISQKLDILNAGIQSATTQTDGLASKAKTALYNAEELLKKEDFLKAYEEFKAYTLYMPDSYVGYEGMFRALTNNYMDDAGQYKRIPPDMTEATVKNLLADGTDVLTKAWQCEDCNKEELLSKYKKYYETSLKTLRNRILYSPNPNDVESLSEEQKQKQISDFTAKAAQYEREIENTKARISRSKEAAAKVNALSEDEREAIKRKDKTTKILYAVVAVLILLLGGRGGLFLNIILMAAVLVLVVRLLNRKSDSGPKSTEKLEQKLNQQKEELQALQEKLVIAKSPDDNSYAVSNEELEDFILNNCSSAYSAEQLYQKYSELERPKEKTGYDVILSYSKNSGFPESVAQKIIIKYGGYAFIEGEGEKLLMAKGTRANANILMKVKDVSFMPKYKATMVTEIADSEQYLLLLMYDESEWAEIIGGKKYDVLIEEITGKRPSQHEHYYLGPDYWEWYGDAPRIITRSKDKGLLLDYADQLKALGAAVKVV